MRNKLLSYCRDYLQEGVSLTPTQLADTFDCLVVIDLQPSFLRDDLEFMTGCAKRRCRGKNVLQAQATNAYRLLQTTMIARSSSIVKQFIRAKPVIFVEYIGNGKTVYRNRQSEFYMPKHKNAITVRKHKQDGSIELIEALKHRGIRPRNVLFIGMYLSACVFSTVIGFKESQPEVECYVCLSAAGYGEIDVEELDKEIVFTRAIGDFLGELETRLVNIIP